MRVSLGPNSPVKVYVQPDEMPPMNATTHSERQTLELVDIIDLKWLMAKDGLHVHVERLQNDPAYALDCLNKAAASPRAAVQAVARRLRDKLGIAPV
jgi:hypothetical protein